MGILVKNGNVVFPNRFVRKVDLLISDGLISKIGIDMEEEGDQVVEASGKYVFPGVIDSHFHAGIYRPLPLDARSESASAVAGGVTTLLSYFRTGRYYMNSSAPYSTLFKEVLKQSEGNYYTDYGYHLAPITRKHLEEMPYLTREYGIATYKYYMFLRGIDASGPRNEDPSKGYLLSADPYDLGHLQKVMTQVARIRQEIGTVRLSIHAEDSELNRVNSEEVQNSSEGLKPLEMNNRARPPESERFALIQAAELANHTGCPINILHLSSKVGLETVKEMRRAYPKLDMIVETAPHYLVLDDRYGSGSYGKVFPPIRTPVDSEALWDGIATGEIDTVASDHCCSNSADKSSDIWSSKAGFGGIELLLPSVITGGHIKRHIRLEQLAALTAYNPAKYFGLSGKKGDIAVGCDADLAICDLSKTRTVRHSELHSAQDFSPFDGLELTGWPETTILRGSVVYRDGEVLGTPRGEYLNRSRSFASSPIREDIAPSRSQ